MFDAWLEESLGDPSALLHLAADNLITERRAGCRKLLIAAAWADCHGAPDDREPAGQSVLVERYLRLGALGTPLVAECCPAELGLAQHTGPVAARQLIADALTIRHRLPHLWARVQAGEVLAWKARQIAQRTSQLPIVSAQILDRLVSPQVEAMAWSRFEKVLDATMLHVDEATYQRRAEQAAAQRDARLQSGEHGLKTLIARLEAGDAAVFMALVERVAECLASDGDDDPIGVRRSRAFGIIAHQARLRDLLARHADQPDDLRHPEERVKAHEDDPSDPWAADDLPDAGWETAAHGNYHQPTFDDLDDCRNSHTEPDHESGSEESPVDAADQDWYDEQRDHADDQVPAAFDRRPVNDRAACRCGSTFDLRPYTKAELSACRTTTVVHVHVTDRTLMDQRGVLRTEAGPITLDQFRRWLTDSDAKITIRPVLDPANVAAVDSYEIPQVLREAVHTRHPGSIWPYSPATEITTGGRLDLDHTLRYVKDGPPGQTATDRLGPLARSEHRPKTVGGWQARQPVPGTYLWRSPRGWICLVTNQGTLLLGDTGWAHQIWKTAAPPAPQSNIPA